MSLIELHTPVHPTDRVCVHTEMLAQRANQLRAAANQQICSVLAQNLRNRATSAIQIQKRSFVWSNDESRMPTHDPNQDGTVWVEPPIVQEFVTPYERHLSKLKEQNPVTSKAFGLVETKFSESIVGKYGWYSFASLSTLVVFAKELLPFNEELIILSNFFIISFAFYVAGWDWMKTAAKNARINELKNFIAAQDFFVDYHLWGAQMFRAQANQAKVCKELIEGAMEMNQWEHYSAQMKLRMDHYDATIKKLHTAMDVSFSEYLKYHIDLHEDAADHALKIFSEEDLALKQEMNDFFIDQIPLELDAYNYRKKVYFPAERDPLRLAYLDFIKTNQHKYAPGIVPRRNLK